MNRSNYLQLFVSLVALVTVTLLWVIPAQAQFNEQINYQGRLLDSTGSAVADGTYAMEFKLYTVATSGTAIWTETLTGANEVTVIDGLFSVMLGSTSPLTSVDFNQTLYLGVTIEADAEMAPRKILGAVPAAFVAKEAGNAGTVGGVASTSFLRSDDADTMSASSSSSILTVIQNGLGKVASFFSGVTEVFTILNNGNVGIGTSTPTSRLAVAGNAVIGGNLTATGTLSVGTLNGLLLGTNGAVSAVATSGLNIAISDTTGILAATRGGTGLSTITQNQLLIGGAGNTWTQVATSSLGLGNGTFLGLTDTPSSYTANRIMFTNSGATALTDSANFLFDGSRLATLNLGVTGTSTFAGSSAFNSFVGVGTTSTAAKLTVDGDVSYGSELITNGSFTGSGTGWTFQADCSYYDSNNATALYDATCQASSDDTSISQSVTLVPGTTYRLTFDVVTNGDAPRVSFSSNSFTAEASNGANSFTFIADGTGSQISFDSIDYITDTGWSIDNVSIQEVMYTPALAVTGDVNFVGDSSVTGTGYISGKVGIGTAPATSRLTVYEPSASSDILRLDGASGNQIGFESQDGGGSIFIKTLRSGGNSWLTEISPQYDIGWCGGGLGCTGNGMVKYFTITSNGNVGIGSTTPSTRLSVAGGGLFGGDLTATGTLVIMGTSTLATTTVAGDIYVTGAFRDSSNNAGTSGMILQTTGSGTQWVATSSLGIGGGSTFSNSAQLAALLSDETGSAGGGLAVFSNAPTFTGITNFADLIAANATTTNASTTQLAISSLTSGRLAYVGTGGRLIDSTNLLFDGSRLATLNLAVTGTSTFSGTSTLATTTIASSTIGTLNLTNALALGMGGTGATTAAGARTNLGATTIGSNIFTLTNPSSSTLLRLNADNTVSALSTSSLNIDLGNTVGTLGGTRGGTGLSTVTQNQLLIGGAGNTWTQIATTSLGLATPFSTSAQLAALLSDETGSAGGGLAVFSISPTITGTASFASTTNSGLLTVAGTSTMATTTMASSTIRTLNLTNALAVAMGGTGATSASGARTNLGATTIGSNIFTLTNPSSSTLLRLNADNTVSAISTSTLNIDLANTVGTLGGTRGGTGLSTVTQNQLLIGGAGNTWTQIATSSLGLGNGTFLGLTDVPSSYTANRIMFTNSGATALTDSANFTFDGTNLGLGGAQGIAWGGTRYLYASTTNDSIAFGENAGAGFGAANIYNIALGFEAGRFASTSGAGYNILAGFQAGRNLTGSSSILIGREAGSLMTGSRNIVLGNNSGVRNDGTNNVLIGHHVGNELRGSGNVALGSNIFTNGSAFGFNNNVAIGFRAGPVSDGGNNNIFIGYQAGDNVVLGATNNIIIGYDIDAPIAAGTNTLNIGNLIFGTNVDGSATTVSTGNIGIGTSSPNARLTIQSTASSSDFFNVATTTGASVFKVLANSNTELTGQLIDRGTTWTARTAAGNNDSWQSVAYGNGLFVAVGIGPDRVMTSPDGINWTVRSAAGNDDSWTEIVYGNGLFVAVGIGPDRVMTSPDGINWTVRSAAGNNDSWIALTYGNGLFVAAGQTGGVDRLMTSPDGITWTARSAAGDDDGWTSLTYGNGRFVAVGIGTDRVMTSPDGITWATTTAAGDDDSWTSLTYGKGLFVAVGSGPDRVMTSPDGITWTVRSAAGNDDDWNSVIYGNGLFVALSTSNDRVMTSPDGITWTVRSAAGNDDQWLYGTYGNGLFVAVGNLGDRVMTSGFVSESRLAANNLYQGPTSFRDVLNIGTTTTNGVLSIQGQTGTTTNLLTIASSTGANLLTFTGAGNLGIGTAAPTSLLTVAGTANITGTTTLATTSLTAALLDVQGSSGTNGMVLLSTGTSTRWAATSTLGLGSGGGSLFTDGGATTYLTSLTDNLAIGTTSASERLTVSGNINLLGGTPTIKANGSRMFQASTTRGSYFIGEYAGDSFVSGSNLIAIGTYAAQTATSATDIIAIGRDSGRDNTSGGANVFIGPAFAGSSNTTGSGNVFIGQLAGGNNTIDNDNTFVGYSAGNGLISGGNNAFYGAFTGLNLATSSNSVLMGYGAGWGASGSYEANRLTILGREAGYNLQTGADNNILIGHGAGYLMTTGANNIVLGYNIEAPSNTGSNQLNIGNLIFGTGLDGTGTTLSSGNIGIGSSSPSAKLTVAGTFRATGTSTLATTTITRLSLAGALFDSTNASGTLGMVLQSTGTSTRWVATSTLGLSGGSNFFTDAGATTYLTSLSDNLAIGTTSASEKLTVNGNINLLGGTAGINWNGNRVLSASTTKGNYFFGYQAGESVTTGNSLIAIGWQALQSATSTSGNIAIGDEAGRNTTSGDANVFIGPWFAGAGNTTGSRNVFVGQLAGANNTTGWTNSFLGYGSAQELRSGDNNSYLGAYTGVNLATTSNSVLIGESAAFGDNGQYEANNLTIIGRQAGYNLQTGADNNILIGVNAGYNMTTGANNLIIGASIEAPSNTASNQLNIGNLIFGTGIDGTGTTLSSGNIGIGSSSPSAKLTVAGTFRATGTSTLATTTITRLSLAGALFDSTNASGTLGMVLQSTGTSTRWVATSTLGISGGGGTFLSLTDTLSSYTANRVIFTNSGATALTDSANFTFDGSRLSTLNLAVNGTSTFTGTTTMATTSIAGLLQMGTTSVASRFNLDVAGFNTAGTAGLNRYYTSTNAASGTVQFGEQGYFKNSATATTTIVGSMFRIEDSSTLGNTVRGLEVQANRGTNTQGENTALSGFARTFGVRGFSSGDAGSLYEPAGGYFEIGGTTQGNAIRGYSSSITTSELLHLFQDTSTFAGTGLLMNFGNGTGSFSSTTSRFIDLQNAGSSRFTVSAYGTTTIGNGTTNNQAGLQIGFGGLCVDNDGSCTASTSGRISSVSAVTGNSDLAEMYFSRESLKTGEIVYTKGELSVGRASQETKDLVLGVVSTKPGLLLGFDDTSLTPGEAAYPIALKGRVPIRLSTENGPIKAGDQLTVSSLPGVAMKATSTGVIIGVALEDFDGTRAYSDTYINQFGDDIAEPVFVPITSNKDPRINDGCYYSGGNAAGRAPCVPLKASTPDAQVLEAAELVATEARARALQALAHVPSERQTLPTGTVTEVGQVTMFVNLGYRYLTDETIEHLAQWSSPIASSTPIAQEVVTDSVWTRLQNLARGFVDGILTVAGLKTDRIETKELCVDGVCVTADDLRRLLGNSTARSVGESEPEASSPEENNQPIEPGPEPTTSDSGGASGGEDGNGSEGIVGSGGGEETVAPEPPATHTPSNESPDTETPPTTSNTPEINNQPEPNNTPEASNESS